MQNKLWDKKHCQSLISKILRWTITESIYGQQIGAEKPLDVFLPASSSWFNMKKRKAVKLWLYLRQVSMTVRASSTASSASWLCLLRAAKAAANPSWKTTSQRSTLSGTQSALYVGWVFHWGFEGCLNVCCIWQKIKSSSLVCKNVVLRIFSGQRITYIWELIGILWENLCQQTKVNVQFSSNILNVFPSLVNWIFWDLCCLLVRKPNQFYSDRLT